jgi:hypothetical protein
MHGSLNAGDLLAAEIDQRRESGFLTRLFSVLDDAPRDPGLGYQEPDALEQIKAAADWDALRQAQGAGGVQGGYPIDERYADQVLRAWTGRIAGNMLGKPVENGDLWTPAAITSFLRANHAWPLVDYFPDLADTGDDHPDYLPNHLQTTSGGVNGSSREWIGAAIRADVFGYVCPGDPARAAELACNDAALSHRGNGIYGEMWCAALVAAAFTAASAAEALETSMKVVPRSRLYRALDETRNWHGSGLSWEQTRTKIESAFGHYGWVHTINNAAALAAGLLYGDGDFSHSIGLTVCGGWDTDSNGGTAGSVAGLLAQTIPRSSW